MKTTVGRIVLFHVDDVTQQTINKLNSPGFANTTCDVLPAVIVRVWSDDYVNLKVLMDAQTDIWVTSVRSWNWAAQLAMA